MNEIEPVPGTIEYRLSHSTFRQPSDQSVKVWRYMDLPKFICLLTEPRLFMARLDRLGDPHEGALTERTKTWIETVIREHKLKADWGMLAKMFRESALKTYVSCWHANLHESEAMWRLYCGQGGGVAIQTTYRHLVSAITNEQDSYIGLVTYMDYELGSIPEANTFAPVMHKRVAFAHEHEVRLVTRREEAVDSDTDPFLVTTPFDCDRLVEHIHVSPYASQYFFDAVQAVVRALAPELENRLRWSVMKAVPFFGDTS